MYCCVLLFPYWQQKILNPKDLSPWSDPDSDEETKPLRVKWYIQDQTVSRGETRTQCLAHCQGLLESSLGHWLILHVIFISYFYSIWQNNMTYIRNLRNGHSPFSLKLLWIPYHWLSSIDALVLSILTVVLR